MSTIDQTAVVAEMPLVADETQVVSTSQLRELKAGENFSARTTYEGNGIVSTVFSFRPYENGPRYEKCCIFDYNSVTEEQLYLLATSSVRIRVQHLLRQLPREEMLNSETLSKVDVLKDVVATGPRGQPDTVESLTRRLARKLGISEDLVKEAVAHSVATEQQ